MKAFFLLGKLFLSAALILFLLSSIDLISVKNLIFTREGSYALLTAILIITLQSCVSGARLPYILPLPHHTISTGLSIRLWFIGSFFSQIVVSFLSGDAVRIWCLKRHYIPTRIAISGILLDRVIGFIALIVILLLTLPFLNTLITSSTIRLSILLLSLISAAAIVVFLLLGALPQATTAKRWIKELIDLCSNSRHLFSSPQNTFIALLLSFGVQLLNTLAISKIFYCYGVDVSFFSCLILATPAMLISMLPISIAGWGVRETAMITAFSFLGIPQNTILACSITFGLALSLVSIPGILFFVFEKKAKPLAPKPC